MTFCQQFFKCSKGVEKPLVFFIVLARSFLRNQNRISITNECVISYITDKADCSTIIEVQRKAKAVSIYVELYSTLGDTQYSANTSANRGF